MNNNPNVMKYISSDFNPTSASIEAEAIIKQKKYYRKFHDFGLWMIQEKDKTIGWISIKYNSDLKAYELGYRLKECEWGRGIVTEACLGMLDYLEKIGVHDFQAVAMVANTASISVMKKIGMTYLKTTTMYNEEVVIYKGVL